MCQQKRLNIGLEHYPGTKGVKREKANNSRKIQEDGMSNVTIEC